MQCLLGAGGPSPVIRDTVLILAQDRVGGLFTKGSVPCFYVDKEGESSSFVHSQVPLAQNDPYAKVVYLGLGQIPYIGWPPSLSFYMAGVKLTH